MEEGTLFLFSGSRKDRIRSLYFENDAFLLLINHLTDCVDQWLRRLTDANELSKEEFSRLMLGFTVTSSICLYLDIGGQD